MISIFLTFGNMLFSFNNVSLPNFLWENEVAV